MNIIPVVPGPMPLELKLIYRIESTLSSKNWKTNISLVKGKKQINKNKRIKKKQKNIKT